MQPNLLLIHSDQHRLAQRMAGDRRWKYAWNATAEDELHDLFADPGRLSRAADPYPKEEFSRLRHRQVEWMRDIGDPVLNPWTQKQLLQGLSL